MALSPSVEPGLQSLDDLLREAEELDREMHAAHPELYRSIEKEKPSASAHSPQRSSSFDFPVREEEPPRPMKSALVPEPQEDILPDIDEDNLQAYFLRRKFEHLPSDLRFERASGGETVSRMGDSPAQLPDEELFLYALTKLNAGVSDEALSAIALMERRQGMNPLVAFLPA